MDIGMRCDLCSTQHDVRRPIREAGAAHSYTVSAVTGRGRQARGTSNKIVALGTASAVGREASAGVNPDSGPPRA